MFFSTCQLDIGASQTHLSFKFVTTAVHLISKNVSVKGVTRFSYALRDFIHTALAISKG
jgi:hypothetical protein